MLGSYQQHGLQRPAKVAGWLIMQEAAPGRLVEEAMDYDQIDVLDKGIMWQGGALDAAIDTAVLVPCWSSAWTVARTTTSSSTTPSWKAVLAVWIDDVPAGCLKGDVLTGLADAIVAWLNNGGNVYPHCPAGREPGQLHRHRVPITTGHQQAPAASSPRAGRRPRRRDLLVFVVNGFRVSILKPVLLGWVVRVENGPVPRGASG
jgi:hypothetical protein